MSTEHFIAGKDASLESSIERMQAQLARIGFHVEERSWLNPVGSMWSVHLVDRDCPALFSNGKGSSQLAARASALGEFIERLSCTYFWAHYYLGETLANDRFVHHPQERWFAIDAEEDDDEIAAWPDGLLTDELQSFYNPDQTIPAQRLVDFNSGNRERGICALPFTRLADGACCWFPVNLIGNLYVSNGMSVGNSEAEARTQALSEIVERNVKFRILRDGVCLPDVPEAVIARFPQIAADIASLRAAGYGILVKDASLGGQYPVMNVTLLNPDDHGCYTSFGAHPRFEIALERALTELLQGRALDALGGFPEPGFDLDEVASAPNLEIHFVDSSGVIHWDFLRDTPDFEFCDWNFSAANASTQDDYQWLVGRIQDEGYDIYLAETRHLGTYACRILVPGMSEIYPIDDLEYENNSIGNGLREAILNLPDLDDEECEDLLDTLNDSGLDDQRPVAALIGLAPDAGSFWEDLRIGELKTLLALATGNREAIREGCEWIRHFAQLQPERRQVYRAIETLMELEDLSDSGDALPYRPALAQLYGAAVLEHAEALLAGDERFFAIEAPGLGLADCFAHRRLLEAYGKVHRLLAEAR